MAHPTIVRVFDAGEETVRDPSGHETQLPFIVMEYVDGRLLKDIIADGPAGAARGRPDHRRRAHRARVLAPRRLVHRDIKPGNIMVTTTGQVKVMDFGIARAVSDNSATVAETSAILGTAAVLLPRAGQRRDGRRPHRPVLHRRRAVRAAHRAAAVPRRLARRRWPTSTSASRAVAPSSLNPRSRPRSTPSCCTR